MCERDPQIEKDHQKRKSNLRKNLVILAITLAIVAVAVGAAIYRNYEREQDRQDRREELYAITCSNFNVVEGILLQPQAPASFYEAIGLSPTAAKLIVERSKQNLENNLQVLGPRPEYCPKPPPYREK